jgi:WD40 repeat protein
MDRAQDLATGEVTCIAVSQNGSVACTTTSDGQLLCIPIGAHADIRVEAVGYMVTPFHGGHIVGLDVCERKPLLVTCSRDLTVKIFNFVTLELEISKSFADEIFYVSIHPSGLHIAIGFADKLRLFHVLVDELKPYKEFAIKVERKGRRGSFECFCCARRDAVNARSAPEDTCSPLPMATQSAYSTFTRVRR